MTSSPPRSDGRTRHHRDSLEFARVVNLSDAVFAIAMTLLVLGLEVPDVGSEQLTAELVAALPQLAAFVLSFALVANIWWQHHRLFSRLDTIDSATIALDLALLGAVALVPFPTGALGRHPFETATVLPFAAVFVLLVGLFLASVVHAQRVDAWSRSLPTPVFGWVVAGYVSVIVMMAVAAVVALWSPIVALALLAVSNVPEVLIARRAPDGYRDWS
jgi:uncharacterized membrane protein